ncbi:MAG TPA: hypothetical protein VHW23_08080 [Kofleriaceae bacterium]|jgi:hypothetical protein|nr:hypothetical protein [Kofleriaceae bacterium]
MNRLAPVAIAGVLVLPGGRAGAAPLPCPAGDATPSIFAVSGAPVLCMSETGDCLGIVALSADEVAILWENQGALRAARVKIGKHLKVATPRKLPGCRSDGDL